MAIILNYKKGKKIGEEIEKKEREREKERNRSERSNKSMDLKDYELSSRESIVASIHS